VQRVFDTRKPDWILLDCDSAKRIPGTPLWRQIAVIFELKASRSFAPTKGNPESSLIVQCTDYARLHLSLRPFQRFSIQFSLCGNLFNCWLIDRTGVVISDTVDIATDEGVNIFIRALVQVTTNLTMHDLGMDPTVTLDTGHLGDFEIPQFAVKMPSGNTYTTRGPPIWQSSSIFGRGTVVWKVKAGSTAVENSSKELPRASMQDTAVADPEDSPDLILKSAYRHPDRIAESKFYSAIEQAKHSGVAVFLEGGDVMHKEKEVRTATHRHGLTPSAQDSIAHRLVLKSKGRRLSEFNTLLELLEAVLASVRGMCP
jgi:Fungal protein kinase